MLQKWKQEFSKFIRAGVGLWRVETIYYKASPYCNNNANALTIHNQKIWKSTTFKRTLPVCAIMGAGFKKASSKNCTKMMGKNWSTHFWYWMRLTKPSCQCKKWKENFYVFLALKWSLKSQCPRKTRRLDECTLIV